jgi:uncharacterized protein (TIGR02996 family)
MPHNPFPDPAAVLPGEAAMLAAVLADLTNDLPKLVYADWLEEHADPRGPFLREFTAAARNGGKLPKPGRLSKSWLDLTGITAVSAARDHELPISPDDLLRDALPALTFKSEPATDADILIGQSKFGGEPDVPRKFEWPEYQGRPLSFLAQFNLMRLSDSPVCRELPRDGLLSVFYAVNDTVITVDDVGGWRVYHFSNLDALERRPNPTDLDASDLTPPCRFQFAETITIQEGHRFESDAHFDAYHEHVRNEKGHQLLGQPNWLQGGAAWFYESENGRPKNCHLLTLDGDRNAGWSWGDAGLLYFGISADDLKAGRFDRTLFEFQCC